MGADLARPPPPGLRAASGAHHPLILIDFGMWNAFPLAHDLTQLLVGDVQIGIRSACDLGGLGSLSELLLAACAEGLDAERTTVDREVLRRAHAVQLFLFAGLSSLPFEPLDGPSDVLAAIVEHRDAVTRFSLELLARTSSTGARPHSVTAPERLSTRRPTAQPGRPHAGARRALRAHRQTADWRTSATPPPTRPRSRAPRNTLVRHVRLARHGTLPP